MTKHGSYYPPWQRFCPARSEQVLIAAIGAAAIDGFDTRYVLQ